MQEDNLNDEIVDSEESKMITSKISSKTKKKKTQQKISSVTDSDSS